MARHLGSKKCLIPRSGNCQDSTAIHTSVAKTAVACFACACSRFVSCVLCSHTLTSGVLSGIGREIQSQAGSVIPGGLQTDAAINPGESRTCLLSCATTRFPLTWCFTWILLPSCRQQWWATS